MSESIPPLRVSLDDASFSQIPVFELQFSGGTLTKLSPTKVRYAPDVAAANTSAIVYAATGGYFIMAQTNDANLLNAKLLLSGTGASIRTDGGATYVDVTTQNILGKVNTDTTIIVYYPITGGGSLNTSRLLQVDTAFLVHTGSTIWGGKVGTDTTIVIYYPISGGGSMSTSRTISVDTAFLLNTGRTISTVYPISGGGNLSLNRELAIDTAFLTNTGSLYFAGSGLGFVTWKAEANLSGEKVLTAGSSVVIHTDATSVYIDATTATNASNVTTGSAQSLAFYKSADTSIYPSHISESTGTGIALWNAPLLATDPTGHVNGDIWFLSSGGVVYFRVNTNNAIKTLTFS